jgi:hypothetical protein
MRSIASALALILGLGIAGCSGIKVSTDYNEEFDFSRFKTFDWVGQRATPLRDPLIDTALIERRVKRAVEQELAIKGYERAPADEPDFLIAYHLGTQSQVDVSTCGYHYPTSPHCWGREIDAYTYTEGTLILDFISPDNSELVWRGTASGAIHDPEQVESTINAAVRKILKSFPPG